MGFVFVNLQNCGVWFVVYLKSFGFIDLNICGFCVFFDLGEAICGSVVVKAV